MLADVAGTDVLCLAAGGGQQSVAFALCGARVTVIDFSATQIERDRATAAHHGVPVTAIEGDMRDLGRFPDRAFDVVWQAHALNFVPDPAPVLDGVARLLRPGGLYRLEWTNPFLHGLWDDTWTGTGYELRRRYEDGGEILFADPEWDVQRPDAPVVRVRGPREWRHGLGTIVNGVIARGMRIRGLWESIGGDASAAAGTWPHLETVAPMWLTLWAERAAGR
jgi:SAM-dependent methyltransferase